MANTYTNLLHHIVFATKRREPLIAPRVEPMLHAYMGSIVRNHDGHLLCAGGTYDHVHLLVVVPAATAVAFLMRSVKGSSSEWINASGCIGSHFQWQAGYSAFSVSEAAKADVMTYIRGQKEHHRVKTFREEYIELLQRNGVSYDERYLWD